MLDKNGNIPTIDLTDTDNPGTIVGQPGNPVPADLLDAVGPMLEA
jgi:hypothetical protein